MYHLWKCEKQRYTYLFSICRQERIRYNAYLAIRKKMIDVFLDDSGRGPIIVKYLHSRPDSRTHARVTYRCSRVILCDKPIRFDLIRILRFYECYQTWWGSARWVPSRYWVSFVPRYLSISSDVCYGAHTRFHIAARSCLLLSHQCECRWFN